MRRKYCFFDYDGTLRSRALDTIPPSAHTALDKLRKNGHFVALATGRLQSDALAVLAPQGIDTMVADGGNSITIDGKLISIEGMPLVPSRAFVHRLDADGWAWAVNHENARTCLTRDERYAGLVSNLYYAPIIDPALDIDTLDPIYKIFVPCKTGKERINRLHRRNMGTLLERARVRGADRQGARHTQDDDPARCAHRRRRRLWRRHERRRHVSPRMDQRSHGNAVPELKTRADLVTTSVDEDGIWNACVKLGLIEG